MEKSVAKEKKTDPRIKRPWLRPPWTKEEAIKFGKKGGQNVTEKQRLICSIRNMKHGKTVKNKAVLKAITPTLEEQIAGITMEDKIEQLKSISPTLASRNLEEAITNYGETLAEMRKELFELESLYKKAAEDDKDKIVAAKSKLWWKMKYAEKEWEFISGVFGIGKPNFTIETSTETKEETITLTKIMERVLGETE